VGVSACVDRPTPARFASRPPLSGEGLTTPSCTAGTGFVSCYCRTPAPLARDGGASGGTWAGWRHYYSGRRPWSALRPRGRSPSNLCGIIFPFLAGFRGCPGALIASNCASAQPPVSWRTLPARRGGWGAGVKGRRQPAWRETLLLPADRGRCGLPSCLCVARTMTDQDFAPVAQLADVRDGARRPGRMCRRGRWARLVAWVKAKPCAGNYGRRPPRARLPHSSLTSAGPLGST